LGELWSLSVRIPDLHRASPDGAYETPRVDHCTDRRIPADHDDTHCVGANCQCGAITPTESLPSTGPGQSVRQASTGASAA
jgi:hypothetical protein